MFSISLGMEEYIMTLGIVASFVGMIATMLLSRKEIKGMLVNMGLSRRVLLGAIAIAIVFLGIEMALVKPTQQLFFDDSIYQGMALHLLRTGQAWFCDYGTPFNCTVGEIFHEPIGESFNLAMGFALGGVSRVAAYNTQIALAMIAVLMTFFVSLLVFKNRTVALFSELFMAVSPIMLIWGAPTTSDMPALTYALIALFAVLVFMHKKSAGTFGFALFALVLSTYMKVNSLLLLPVFLIVYLILDDKGIASSIKSNIRLVKQNVLNTKVLMLLLLSLLLLAPEVGYTVSQLDTGYGYSGTYMQLTCSPNLPAIHPNASISLQNFNANICANLNFWFNYYKTGYIIQPLLYTLIAIFGGLVMIFKGKTRELAAIGIWFIAFFLLYTAFYAGGVNYGVDWRFMLSVIAQASMLAGFGAASIYGLGDLFGR